ncbi:timeless-domain-containing protein [Delitschia confertaspora ATCC 74209]|uniref:Topoisomerase 1-associated factor 1 n=1 Tax=Delitschia confertaspora ATCC 74209 TaxID=1513339 RepID=A0A9P4JK44_9PLEO|nr:timeless-domain-containing protein [Delitschia confertaspora ATCC 74209]
MAQQTTLDEWSKDAQVDPEVRAHVYSLISALGGGGDDGTYALGDDALLCLKDLRKWLKVADGQLNRRDVARCMAEANIVKGDLLEILAKISPRVTEDKLKHKIAVACLELLVPLTWPFEIDPDTATMNHHRHAAYIQLAQIGYKRAILQFDRARILQTAVRTALPSMAVPSRERTPRDEGIIRIALYFIRNIAMLSPPKNVPFDGDEAEVSRSTTIDVFQDQDIFQVILSVASSISEDFVSQDVVILEILFYLLKGVDADKLFMEEKKLNTKNTEELKMLIQKEKAMLAGYARHAPTRHNRFGTMLWVKRDDDKVSTVSGQDVLGKAQKTIEKMDSNKKWNKPKRPGPKKEKEVENDEFDLPVSLSTSARKSLKDFVEEFLDSSFNPLFLHLRKTIEREAERVEERHRHQFFYLISWFLRAECSRRRTIKQKAADPKDPAVLNAEDESYGLIAEVMNQETFILLNRFMQRAEDEKAWQDLNAGMKCFTQILLTVQEMSESAIEDDQEIAENIQNRIFYEESTHDRVVHILRSYNNQGFGYLDACTELSHVFLRMLERYSKQNVDLQIRSKKRARKVRKAKAQAAGGEDEEDGNVSETQDITEAQRTVTERKFDFTRFSAKFVNQNSVDTFVAFTRYYKELNTEQLKRAHRFFYRVVFKNEMGVLLYRVDILQLFLKMIKGDQGLDPESPCFKEWEEFVRHFFRQVVKRVQEHPELIVEMLFSKIPATIFYLEHGYDREVTVRAPRAPAELEVKPGMEKEDQIGVAVGVLVNQQKSDHLHWVRDILSTAAEERQAWEVADEARKATAANAEGEPAAEKNSEDDQPKAPSIFVKPNNEERRIAMFKDNKLRLLMTLIGFARLGADNDPDAPWVIPSPLSSIDLKSAIDLIRKFEFDPPTYEDGKSAEDFLRSKVTAARSSRQRAEFDDDSDGKSQDEDEDRGEYGLDAPISNPAARKTLKRRRRRSRTPQELDDEERDRRAEVRRKKELEKQAKVKSTMFVHDSDDEWEYDPEKDREFFERENATREATKRSFLKALGYKEPASSKSSSKKRKTDGESKKGRKKRKSVERHEEDEREGNDDVTSLSSGGSSPEEAVIESDEDEEDAMDTPLSSQPVGPSKPTARKPSTVLNEDVDMDDDDDDDDDDNEDAAPVIRRTAARNVRAGFIIDSDSE